MQKRIVPADSRTLGFLYGTFPGRLCLKILTAPWLSRLCGRFLDSRLSARLIPGFIRRQAIDLTDCEPGPFPSFNAFFTRRLRDGARPVDPDPNALIAPCDGLLTVYPITGDTVLPVKQSRYTLSSLLDDEALAARYKDGLCLVFRLCVHHYHRYVYAGSGRKEATVHIPGILHTVRPIALESLPVFTQNSRSYTVIHTAAFGSILQMEVGAMLVGKIQNHETAPLPAVTRGDEKGLFLYGGSTVILLLEPGRATLSAALLEASAAGLETPVRLGQAIGRATGQTAETLRVD